MPRRPPQISIQEFSGAKYMTGDVARRMVLPDMGHDLVVTLRTMIVSGELAVRDGRLFLSE